MVVVEEGVVLLVVVVGSHGTTTRTSRRFLMDKVLAVAAVGGLVSHSQPHPHSSILCGRPWRNKMVGVVGGHVLVVTGGRGWGAPAIISCIYLSTHPMSCLWWWQEVACDYISSLMMKNHHRSEIFLEEHLVVLVAK